MPKARIREPSPRSSRLLRASDLPPRRNSLTISFIRAAPGCRNLAGCLVAIVAALVAVVPWGDRRSAARPLLAVRHKQTAIGVGQVRRAFAASQPARITPLHKEGGLEILEVPLAKQTCKPSSVLRRSRSGDHLSGMTVTRHLKRPTRGQWPGVLWSSYSVLLRMGFTQPTGHPADW